MEEWDKYWAGKQKIYSHLYDRIAVFYRERIIKPYLKHYINSYFDQNAKILHAGCGGGQVEEEIASSFTIIGMDISPNALRLYTECHDESNLILGDITSIGIKEGSLDGIYNLGVMEHFSENDINKILREFRRILKKNGVLILFWPPEYGMTVIFLKIVHFFLNSILRWDIHLHPPEPNLIKSKKWVENIVNKSGFSLVETGFNMADFYTYMVVVSEKTD